MYQWLTNPSIPRGDVEANFIPIKK
ncbi:hypothetical protein PQZ60_gp74 [Klebsiella phage vB_KpnM_FZ14]|nr:hypothetical protein PQZ60_gp74 [Klebsiella phage vB_KpnM_FZ14]